ncbi:hypothetical protein ACFXB3_38970 [Streptomyces sp. NPDC059447]|uniref:hypothetical protein n=1 Tax=Streptomyces sp. NPDC059447 TaxID=3346834 RepID=UPI0036858373
MSSRPHAFEERLKAALLARLPETAPAPAPTRARRYGIPLAVGVATAVVVAVMALPGSTRTGGLPAGGPTGAPGPSATGAPEIKKDPDGSLRFEVPEQDRVTALVDALKKLGVAASLVPMRPPSQCPEGDLFVLAPEGHSVAEFLQPTGHGFEVKIHAKTAPPGYSILFTWAEYYPLGDHRVRLSVSESSRIPPCSVDYSVGLEELLRSGSGAPTGEPADTIRVRTPTVDELPELVRTLQARGVKVAVTQLKPLSECTNLGSGYRRWLADHDAELYDPKDKETLRINAKTVPPGYTLVFGKPSGSSGQVKAGVQESSQVTPCLVDVSPGAPLGPPPG